MLARLTPESHSHDAKTKKNLKQNSCSLSLLDPILAQGSIDVYVPPPHQSAASAAAVYVFCVCGTDMC